MLASERAGRHYQKSRFREDALREALKGRSAAAFERRMGNISHVRILAGLDWIQGYKPYSNPGRRIAEALCTLIGETEPDALDLVSSSADELVMSRAGRVWLSRIAYARLIGKANARVCRFPSLSPRVGGPGRGGTASISHPETFQLDGIKLSFGRSLDYTWRDDCA